MHRNTCNIKVPIVIPSYNVSNYIERCIKYADSVEEVLTEIPEMLKIQCCSYDNSALSSYFDLLAEEVKAKCRKSQ